MGKGEKINSGVRKAVIWSVSFCVMFVFLLGMAHFSLQYGLNIDVLTHAVRTHWLIWLLVRCGIYGVIGIFLYKLLRQAHSVTAEQARQLSRICLVAVVVVELINLTQLVRA